MNIKEKVLAQQEDIITNLKTLVSYPSVYQEDGYLPFGKANQECLQKALEIAQSYGFKTVNLDNYCGYIEMGQGEQVIGILAHLDIVPVSPTWSTNPFELTRIGDKFYGRGTSDDKGAAVCSLAALRILKEIEPTMKKRIRLILGCNEETGSKGIAYYVKKEGYVDLGFTPDGDFPCIYGEKGAIHGAFEAKSEKIIACNGGIVTNAVANFANFELVPNCINEDKLAKYFQYNKIEYTFKDNKLNVKGVAAHASTPHLGVNAISYALEGLYQADINDNFVTEYHNAISTNYDGNGLGIKCEDEYGPLTFNIGIISKENDKISCTIDIRFPVTLNKEEIVNKMTQNKNVIIHGTTNPLFFDPNHPMVKALCDAYYKVTDDKVNKPMVIGGGTYAKSMKNIIAFGCEFPNEDCHIHDDNEFVTLKTLLLQTEIYVEGLINLLNL